jgi:hypothetical protein
MIKGEYMILLAELLAEEEYSPGEVWITKKRYYGAKSATGDIRYFVDREDAVKYAEGNTKPPHPGRPEPKQHKQHHEPKQKYSI